MWRKKYWHKLNGEMNSVWFPQFLQGILLILLGVLIFLVPQILVAFVSSLLIVLGILWISAAVFLRRLKRNFSYVERDDFWF